MRKQNFYTATVVTTRNEFIDAGRSKTPVIFIQGDLKDEIISEIKKEKSNVKGNKAVGKAPAVGAVLFGTSLFIPGVNILAAGIATITLGLATAVANIAGIDHEHVTKYDVFERDNPPTIGLVYRSKYSFEDDAIVGPINLRLCDGKKCPKCGKKLEKHFSNSYCTDCGTRLAATFRLKLK